MSLTDVLDWMNDFTGTEFVWYIKRLSGNDTLANGSHQGGPYIAREFLFKIFPELQRPECRNPDKWFDLYVDSHSDHQQVRVVWYNNRLRGGTRNECRVTNFGGAASALLDPESTGALTVFAFVLDNEKKAVNCRVWVCRHETEEDIVEERIGSIDPGNWKTWSSDLAIQQAFLTKGKRINQSCFLDADEIPDDWIVKFPSGIEIVKKTLELRATHGMNPDSRLIKRQECEFEIFRSIEEAVETPFIQAGFTNLDQFIARAHTVLQRRKVRAGRSLELHTKEIFIEEDFEEGIHFSYQPESELGKNPDFLFPSEEAYKTPTFPDRKLQMLAVKTTCRDRWRQILNEADRISVKHLLTLQRGVSEKQFHEMKQAGVCLVIPTPLIDHFPKSVRPELKTLEDFIGDLRLLLP